jgi:dTDP-4-dehydrorhamnose reductase
MKILLFGSNGYIGSEFVSQLLQLTNIKLIRLLPSRHADGGSYLFKELDGLIKGIKPSVIINCAAYVGGNSIVNCENHKDQAIQSNVIFPRMLGEICQERKIIFGHLSSGCVFNGYPTGGYEEDDVRNMTFDSKCSFYTGTKAMAEDCLNDLEKKYIWRIRIPFDEIDHPRNYLTKLMQFDKLVVASNSISNRKELVTACIECIMKAVPFGIYHVTNPGGIRTDEITAMMRNILKIDKDFQYFESIEAFDKISTTPRSNTILNTEKLGRAGIVMTPVHESVEKALKQWKWATA